VAAAAKTLVTDAAAVVQTWGVGYALNNASEWQEVFKTAAKTALILVILDLLRVTKDAPWFEARELARVQLQHYRCCF
jgi:hypothetical protein